MPAISAILESLSTISNNAMVLAVVWHLIFAFVIIGLIIGWRPSKKIAATALAVPLLSVGILAWIYKNPFNGIIFLVFAISLAVIGLRLPNEKVYGGPKWSLALGALLIIFGWVYPHFIETSNWFKYLYAAPMGLIPCPTLSITIGFALLINRASIKIWSLFLAFIGLFYGLFGFFRLGVYIDAVLIAGALILLIQIFLSQSPILQSQT